MVIDLKLKHSNHIVESKLVPLVDKIDFQPKELKKKVPSSVDDEKVIQDMIDKGYMKPVLNKIDVSKKRNITPNSRNPVSFLDRNNLKNPYVSLMDLNSEYNNRI